MTYLASAYLDGHLKPLLGQTLDVQQAVVGQRQRQAPGQRRPSARGAAEDRDERAGVAAGDRGRGARYAPRRGEPESPDPRARAGDAGRAAALRRGDADARLPLLAAVRGLLRRARARARTRPATVAAAPRARGGRRAAAHRLPLHPLRQRAGHAVHPLRGARRRPAVRDRAAGLAAGRSVAERAVEAAPLRGLPLPAAVSPAAVRRPAALLAGARGGGRALHAEEPPPPPPT